MNFSQDIKEGIAVKNVHLKRATKEQAEKFKKFLLKDIEENNLKMIVDLDDCEFIDSTFISAMVTALKTINAKGGMLKIVADNSEVQSILELTGMVKVFEVYKNLNDAIFSFNHSNGNSTQ